MNHFTKILFFFSLIMQHYLLGNCILAVDAVMVTPSNILSLSVKKRKLLLEGFIRKSKHSIPNELRWLIYWFLYDNPLRYKNKRLPADLSERNLRGFNFTGCQFTSTNLTNTCLAEVILDSTSCNYENEYTTNVGQLPAECKTWYIEYIPEDLQNITKVYPKLPNNTDKAKLLYIASGLARVPALLAEGDNYFKKNELSVRASYWLLMLLRFKKKVGDLGKELTCSLKSTLNYTIEKTCWQSSYSNIEKVLYDQALPEKLSEYGNQFEQGLTKYGIPTNNYFSTVIKTTIKRLQKIYPHIEDKKLQYESCKIACVLSQTYRLSKEEFLECYLFCQNGLIKVKHNLPSNLKFMIDYMPLSLIF